MKSALEALLNMPTISVGPDSGRELQEIADSMARSKKVVVVTGAGISTNCGIPDFRSEGGLYALIQAQYDAAIQNPPWENKDNYDIDDRPRKKRRKWFYEVVRDDGTVVDVIDQELEASQDSKDVEPRRASRKSSRSKSTTPTSSPLSSPPPSSPTEATSSESESQPSEQNDDSVIESSQSSRPDLPNLKGRDLFDSMVWKDAFTTSIFYMFISSLRQKIQDVTAPTTTHNFIKTLQDSGRLVRNYTQNIDCIEERLGMCSDLSLGPGSKTRFNARVQREQRLSQQTDLDASFGVSIVQLHGSLSKLRCGLCLKTCSWDENERLHIISSGQAPDCPSCTDYNNRRTGRGRRGLAVGRLRPDIVLYGEEHPNANLVGPLITHDLALGPDILLILGTSLKVHGLKVIIREFAKTVHDRGGKVIFVNRTKPSEGAWGEFIDYWVGWDCDAWVMDMMKRRPDISLPQGSVQDESKSRRQSSGDNNRQTKKPPRPQATRDDRQSGCYYTFKILDTLRKLPNANGDITTRGAYWQDLRRLTGDARDIQKQTKTATSRSLPPSTSGAAPKMKSRSVTATKPKSTSTRKPLSTSKATTTHTANTSKKRKSYPAAVRDDKKNVAFLTTNIWAKLRQIAPELSEKPSAAILESGRIPLTELHKNMPSYLKPFTYGFPNPSDIYKRSSPNHIPDMPGLEMPNLLTHPPSGYNINTHAHTHTPKPHPLRRSHSYGTRSSRRYSSAGESTFVEDATNVVQSGAPKSHSRPSWGSNESTIVVATPKTQTQEPTPPDSAPMTPTTPNADSQRIKRMGSIGAILSSPDEGSGADVFESAEESPQSPEVFYDATME